LPRPLKYVSKVEILDIPLIGWAMQWAGHIAIRRGNRRSQLQTFKDTVTSLQDGNAVVTFAEGTRSKDGRLKTFKKGPFTMATKAGVDVVPISLVNIWKWCAVCHAPIESVTRSFSAVRVFDAGCDILATVVRDCVALSS